MWQTTVELEPERPGLAADDPRWDVPWLKGLRRVPRNAVWPRLMSLPHPAAVDSLGEGFCQWAADRTGTPLRWWQQLVVYRLLEVNSAGELVWDTLTLSMARQLGKSWLLREICLWRIHQGDRFGEPQDVMHTGKDLAICKEVQRPARLWAKQQPKRFKVREVNGQEEIELLEDGSRWLLRAKDATYGFSVSVAAADEAWKIQAARIEEGLTPTMAERAQPQLLLVSTAHRLATSLMLGHRSVGLATLEEPDGELLIEWSAPADAKVDDRDGWRQASPHWTPRRERMIGRQLELARSGELVDAEEPDPEQSFRAQWLNQWPRKPANPNGPIEPLLPAGLWQDLAEPVVSVGEVWLALEDDYGRGAAVAAVALLPDGRLEVDGWRCEDWDAAIDDVYRVAEWRPVRQLLVGASLLSRVPQDMSPPAEAVGSKEARIGLALFRDLAANGMLVHDTTTRELDEAVTGAYVREQPTGGLGIASKPSHLVRALVWAVEAAHQPVPVPAIH